MIMGKEKDPNNIVNALKLAQISMKVCGEGGDPMKLVYGKNKNGCQIFDEKYKKQL